MDKRTAVVCRSVDRFHRWLRRDMVVATYDCYHCVITYRDVVGMEFRDMLVLENVDDPELLNLTKARVRPR